MLHFSHCEKENLVILMMRVRQGLIKAGEEQYYYDDVLPESQEKFLIDMVIKAYNKEFQYEASS